jgi:serine/threonine protein kinase
VITGLTPQAADQPGVRKSWDGSDSREPQAVGRASNGHAARERESQWARMQHLDPPKPPASSPPVLHVHPPAALVPQPQSAATPVQYQQQPAMRNIIVRVFLRLLICSGSQYCTSTFQVNKRCYIRLDLVGKGGTSRVYRVMSEKNELFAIKRVALDKADHDTMKGYMNEIALLKRLDGNNRIIRLIDSEAKMNGGNSKGYLHLVMECGEIGEWIYRWRNPPKAQRKA